MERPVLPHAARSEAGFTLLELLVVLVILGLLIALVGPKIWGVLGTAQVKIAHQSIKRIDEVLDMYKLDVGSYPTTEQGLQALVAKPSGAPGWHGPYLKDDRSPEDPWHHAYVYRAPSARPGRDYDLCSLGPTGKTGGAGDNAEICNSP